MASIVVVVTVFPHHIGATTLFIVNAKKMNNVLKASPRSSPALVR